MGDAQGGVKIYRSMIKQRLCLWVVQFLFATLLRTMFRDHRWQWAQREESDSRETLFKEISTDLRWFRRLCFYFMTMVFYAGAGDRAPRGKGKELSSRHHSKWDSASSTVTVTVAAEQGMTSLGHGCWFFKLTTLLSENSYLLLPNYHIRI